MALVWIQTGSGGIVTAESNRPRTSYTSYTRPPAAAGMSLVGTYKVEGTNLVPVANRPQPSSRRVTTRNLQQRQLLRVQRAYVEYAGFVHQSWNVDAIGHQSMRASFVRLHHGAAAMTVIIKGDTGPTLSAAQRVSALEKWEGLIDNKTPEEAMLDFHNEMRADSAKRGEWSGFGIDAASTIHIDFLTARGHPRTVDESIDITLQRATIPANFNPRNIT